MSRFSTIQVAKRLGIHPDTLAHYIAVGKVPAPEMIELGTQGRVVHAWTEEQIEELRKLLPKIVNGRKTRWQRQREKQKTQPRAAALPKKRGAKKKSNKP